MLNHVPSRRSSSFSVFLSISHLLQSRFHIRFHTLTTSLRITYPAHLTCLSKWLVSWVKKTHISWCALHDDDIGKESSVTVYWRGWQCEWLHLNVTRLLNTYIYEDIQHYFSPIPLFNVMSVFWKSNNARWTCYRDLHEWAFWFFFFY